MGIINSLYRLISKNLPGAKAPLASDVNQLIDMLNGALDAGVLTLAPQIATLSTAGITAAAQAGSGLGIGLYQYNFTYVTGNLQGDGTTTIAGETPGSSAISVTTTTGNQSVKISGLPAVGSWPASAIGIRIYRTAVGGASGTQKLVTTIYTNYARSTSLTSYTDSTTDGSLGANVPTSNTTGTNLAGINSLSHAGALTALMHYESSLLTTRGVTGTFTRASAANDPTTLANIASGTPRYSSGKFGKGVYIEEGTNNLAENSDAETATSTTQLFGDPLTSYSGSSAVPWTLAAGSFTFSASGATSAASGAQITAGNIAWKPLTGSGGQNLSLTAQSSFTTPATLSTSNNGLVALNENAAAVNNLYQAWISNNTFFLAKIVGGTYTQLTSVAQVPSASHTYTITLSLDHTGSLTAKLYDGANTSGTLLQTLTATDTSLTGGFLIGVGGDTGVVISGSYVSAGWADGWGFTGDQRVAWALTSVNPISGSYSVSAVTPNGLTAQAFRNVSLQPSTTYTVSGYANTTNLGSGAYIGIEYFNGSTSLSSGVAGLPAGTNATARYTNTSTSPSNANTYYIVLTSTPGTAVFDAIQLEQKSYATSYLRNDSTSSSATRAAETLTYPSSLLNASAGTISTWVNVSTATGSNCLFSLNGITRWDIWSNQNGTGTLGLYNGSSWLNANYLPTAGTLFHLAVSWTSTNTYLYINGQKVATGNFGMTSAQLGSACYIGSFGSGSQANATIDELAIFNRALTDAEVYSIYAATQPVIDVFQSDAQTLGGLTKDQVTTNIPNSSLTGPLVSSITAGANVTVTNPTGVGAATVGLSGVVPVANGGTGSSTQNFVDLSTVQTVGGAKTFTGAAALNGGGSIGSGQTLTNNGTISGGTVSGATVSGGTVNPTTLQRGGNTAWDDGNSPKSLAANGYQKFNSGVIMQWGHVSVAANSSTTVTFPLAFPTACGSVTATGNGGNITSGGIFLGSPPTTTTFPVYNSSTTAMDVYWIAIGY